MVERLVVWHRGVLRARGNDAASVGAWSKTVAARFSAGGGAILANFSGTAVGSFEVADIGDVIDLLLDLLDEADSGPLAVSFGVAVSVLTDQHGLVSGPAIEAAESLAVRARPGEVLLESTARERARGLYLFSRQVGSGSAASKAASVDRTHPRRDACAHAMARLGPVPLAPATEALLPALESALRDPGSVLVLRGPVGAGAVELIRAAEKRQGPAHVVELGGASAGIAPLGSLRAGLAREAGLRALAAAAPRGAGALLTAVARGELPSQADLLSALFDAVAAGPGNVWFFLSPLALVDGATLALVLALHRASPRVVLILRHSADAALPPLAGEPKRVELTLPSLRTADARVIAQALLGPTTMPDVARRVAVLGGDTPLGVVEAARAMIGSGDLVLVDDSFVWRSSPRGGVRALALDVLVAERLELLDDESRRVLEAVAVVPDGSPRSLVQDVSARDGVRPRAIVRGLERLAREGWLDARADEMPRPFSSFVRRFVVSALPPSRAGELHRFVAEALAAGFSGSDVPIALEVERAIQLIEGGREDEAAPIFVRAAAAARDAGHAVAAGQLALAVLRSPAMGDARAAALAIARELSVVRTDQDVDAPPRLARDAEAMPARRGRPKTPSAPPEARASSVASALDAPGDPATEERALDEEPDSEGDLVGDVRDAIRRRDFGALEHLAERAIAEGSDMAAVARLRALSEALRGDHAGAQRRLDRARAQNVPRDRRALLTEAVVALRAGRLASSVRLSLSALADARRAGDARGEGVALFTLASCFRALGRKNDAALLESRIDA